MKPARPPSPPLGRPPGSRLQASSRQPSAADQRQPDPQHPDPQHPYGCSMNYRCTCGMDYVVVPKEIPLANDEQVICDCGCPPEAPLELTKLRLRACSSRAGEGGPKTL